MKKARTIWCQRNFAAFNADEIFQQEKKETISIAPNRRRDEI